MYWTDSTAGSINRADLDGSGTEVLVTGIVSPKGIVLLDGRKIYWTDSGTNKIQAANLDGSQIEDIVTGLDYPGDIALDMDGSKIYWTNSRSGIIQRSNFNGSQVEEFGTGSSGGIAIDSERSRLVWTNATSSWDISFMQRPLNGSRGEAIVGTIEFETYGGGRIGAIALDSIMDRIFWGAMKEGEPPDFLGSGCSVVGNQSIQPGWLRDRVDLQIRI